MLGYVNIDLVGEPIWAGTRFHIFDTHTSSHLQLQQPWVHKHHVVPSTYHQYLKAVWSGKKVYANTSEAQF